MENTIKQGSDKMFEKEWNKIAKKVYKNAVNHGF